MLSQSAFAPAVSEAKLAAAAAPAVAAAPAGPDSAGQAAARSPPAAPPTHDPSAPPHPPGHQQLHPHHPHHQRRSHTVCQPLLPAEALAAIASYGAEADAGLTSAQRAYSATGTELGFPGSEPEHHLTPSGEASFGTEMAAAAVAAAAAAAAMSAAAKAAAAAAAAVHRGGWEREWERMQRSRSCELLRHLGGIEEDADAAAWWT
ncbi:hypothetical protein HXX76_011319 [Chlamydomonas incerta]|uniref:Uncharacterized protein n=1 Tax=Chlamydomonas incerta TaxID=51695 RepID=A0A835SVN8_CHLIN|nr:hypothetical protein HXX76_011319 [Chlamydomonas incerta]|eukprot:KAG2429079.1 hypothetical protein HXX76_011319 [Chlamydomonas incerta]